MTIPGAASLVVASLLTPASATLAASAQIQSDFDAKERRLSWQVKNTGSLPIVRLDVPHYHAASFVPPDGWKAKCTNLGGADAPGEGGLCSATAEPSATAIEPGGSRTFIMRLSDVDSEAARGEVKVHLANGQLETIAGVYVSIKPRQGFGLLPTIVLGGALVLYAIWRTLRGQRPPASTTSAPRDDAI